jgi:transcriptional regulator with XRE-family HTH domain
MTEIHKKLRRIRDDFGYSQQNVADMLGIKSQQYISDIESGHTKLTVDMLEEIAEKAYKMTLSQVAEYGNTNHQNNHNQLGGNAAIYIVQQIPPEITDLLKNLTILVNGKDKKK